LKVESPEDLRFVPPREDQENRTVQYATAGEFFFGFPVGGAAFTSQPSTFNCTIPAEGSDQSMPDDSCVHADAPDCSD